MTFQLSVDKNVGSEISSRDRSTSSQLGKSVPQDSKSKKVQWYAYIWDYEPDRTRRERVFVSKLDAYLVAILYLGYFIKNLDQTNISDAFVSSLKEDLAER